MTTAEEIDGLERLADWLDSRFRLPGTNIRFGLDSVLGLVPGVGDTVAVLPAAYVILRAKHLGVPRHILLLMALNLAADTVVGAVPVLGDLFDVGYKANKRNLSLLKKHHSRENIIDGEIRGSTASTDRQ